MSKISPKRLRQLHKSVDSLWAKSSEIFKELEAAYPNYMDENTPEERFTSRISGAMCFLSEAHDSLQPRRR